VKTSLFGIWAYSINSSTGQLLQVPGSPYTDLPVSSTGTLAVEPSGKFLYHGNLAFSIDQGSGALTQLNFMLPVAVYAITKDGLLIANSCSGSNETVSSYNVDSATGALTALQNLVLPCLSPGSLLSVDPSGKFVYVGGAIIQLNPTTGAMSQSGSTLAYDFAFDPVGHFAYATDGMGNLYGFAMDPNSGALNQLPGFPIPFTGGQGQFGIDATGRFLVTTFGSTYQIDPTSGALTPKSGQALSDSTAVGFYPAGSINIQ
jgi:DNA-binding beta-propeller fold protein YncE